MEAVGIPVLQSALDRVKKAMKAMRVLENRRKHYFWHLGELQTIFQHLDGGTRGHAYETLVEFEKLLDNLTDGKNWFDKTASFFQSRRLLKKLEEKREVLKEIVETTQARIAVTHPRFTPRSSQTSPLANSDGNLDDDSDRSPYKADLKKDYDYVKEVVTKEAIDDILAKEAKNALKGVKKIFKEYSKEKLDRAIERFDDNKDSGDGFKKVWDDVMRLAKRECVPVQNPAILVDHGNSQKPASMHQSLMKRFSTPKPGKGVFMLDLSLDYKKSAAGFEFKDDENTGEEVLQACYVFVPGSLTCVCETRVTPDRHFVVKIDEQEVWRGSLDNVRNNSRSFQVQGHQFKRGYSNNGNIWSTYVDGKNAMKLPLLTHQQWVEARQINRLKKATNDVNGILDDMDELSSDDDE